MRSVPGDVGGSGSGDGENRAGQCSPLPLASSAVNGSLRCTRADCKWSGTELEDEASVRGGLQSCLGLAPSRSPGTTGPDSTATKLYPGEHKPGHGLGVKEPGAPDFLPLAAGGCKLAAAEGTNRAAIAAVTAVGPATMSRGELRELLLSCLHPVAAELAALRGALPSVPARSPEPKASVSFGHTSWQDVQDSAGSESIFGRALSSPMSRPGGGCAASAAVFELKNPWKLARRGEEWPADGLHCSESVTKRSQADMPVGSDLNGPLESAESTLEAASKAIYSKGLDRGSRTIPKAEGNKTGSSGDGLEGFPVVFSVRQVATAAQAVADYEASRVTQCLPARGQP